MLIILELMRQDKRLPKSGSLRPMRDAVSKNKVNSSRGTTPGNRCLAVLMVYMILDREEPDESCKLQGYTGTLEL